MTKHTKGGIHSLKLPGVVYSLLHVVLCTSRDILPVQITLGNLKTRHQGRTNYS